MSSPPLTAAHASTPVLGRVLEPVITSVRRLYEAYPYPSYPLLAKPRWQEGYLTHSRFAAAVCGAAGVDLARGAKTSNTVLIGGGGEILPYIIRKWEPRGLRVVSIDLSRHSTLRARFRTVLSSKPTAFLQGDLDAYLARLAPQSVCHIDAYGVLHHMRSPSATLAAMARVLRPGGTLRLMVYNSPARRWIHHLQRLFALLAIDRFAPADLRLARALLKTAAADAPALALRLGQVATGLNARFADTFLHPREVRLPIAAWLGAVADAGLTSVGLFDRYAELDDLPCPLATMPSSDELSERAADGRFEHNLELFITKGPAPRGGEGQGSSFTTLAYRLKPPPSLWFSFTETKDLSWPVRLRLWHAHLDWVLRGRIGGVSALLGHLPVLATKRLLRLGALLPAQIEDPGRRLALLSPLATSMDTPRLPDAVSLVRTATEAALKARLTALGRCNQRTLTQALARLYAAQGMGHGS